MESRSSVDSILARLSQARGASEVPYMLTGSFASSPMGPPGVTHDVDIIIAPTLGSLIKLLRQFSEEHYYVSRDAALQVYGSEGLFNLIDLETGWKVDFIIRKSRDFGVEEVERRREAEVEGAGIFVAIPAESRSEYVKELRVRGFAQLLPLRARLRGAPAIRTG